MKTVEEIYQELLADFEKRIGMHMAGSCDLAVRLYAVAAQVQALYAQTEWVKQQGFPQTAAGQYLDYHAQMRGLKRSAAVKAVGTLRFSVNTAGEEALPVPKGTVCLSISGVRYETTETVTLAAGKLYVDAAAQAVEAGAAGNAGANTVIAMSVPPAGIVSCTNPEAFTGGEDEEADETLRQRILDSYRRLPNGANAAFYELRALSHLGVEAVRVIPRHQGIGTVGVVVSGAGGVPEQALLQEIQDDLDSVREIAVDVTVMAPEPERVDLAVRILPKPGKSFDSAQAAVRTALTAWFDGGLLGKPVYRTQLGKVILDTGVAETYAITAPTKDLPGNARRLPQLGTLTITEGV